MKRSFTVNGRRIEGDFPPMRRLLDFLRDDLALTGTKEGCGEGECGACSVLLDGRVVNACLVPLFQVEGSQIVTIEGLGSPEALLPIQQAFLEHGAAQCGICTPGMVVAAQAFVDRVRNQGEVTRREIEEALAGNLCRCTGYMKIIEAVAATLEGAC
ncbi:MAG: (2Fe-2S)-binding protein [Deltaproteobacteria bacterium]|nr:MAG: (2Fe-2S)-binding protein [Deltaproteobacteria bacterium]